MKRVGVIGLLGLFLLFGVVALAEGDSIREMKKKMSKAINEQNWELVCTSIEQLGKLDSENAAKVIITVGLRVPNSKVFDTAKKALSGVTDSEAIQYMCDHLSKDRKWEVRCLLAEVLGKVSGEQIVGPLISALSDRKNRNNRNILRELVRSLRKKDDVRAVPPLIDLLEKIEAEKGLLWKDVRKALTALTGVDYQLAADWRKFWDVEKESFKRADESERSKKAEKIQTSLPTEKKETPTFFGKEVMSRRILFIIDTSGSMTAKDPEREVDENGKPIGQPPPPPSNPDHWGGDPSLPKERMRIERVKKELKNCIIHLDPATKFNVMAFSTDVKMWQQQLVKATAKAKKSAIRWAEAMSPLAWTSTDKALEKAFEDKEVDTIYLLSDGQPMRPTGFIPVDTILEWVRNANKLRKVRIFTFGFEGLREMKDALDPKEMMKLLKGLAKEHNGEFKNVHY